MSNIADGWALLAKIRLLEIEDLMRKVRALKAVNAEVAAMIPLLEENRSTLGVAAKLRKILRLPPKVWPVDGGCTGGKPTIN